jgi:PII-like signaling protein
MLQAQIFIDKDEVFGSQPLYEFIIQFLLKQHIAGATAFRGVTGFGEHHQLKRPDSLFSFDEPPMLIIFIDEDEKVMKTLAALRQKVSSGFIVTSKVERFEV